MFKDNCCKREVLNLHVYCKNAPGCNARIILGRFQVGILVTCAVHGILLVALTYPVCDDLWLSFVKGLPGCLSDCPQSTSTMGTKNRGITKGFILFQHGESVVCVLGLYVTTESRRGCGTYQAKKNTPKPAGSGTHL